MRSAPCAAAPRASGRSTVAYTPGHVHTTSHTYTESTAAPYSFHPGGGEFAGATDRRRSGARPTPPPDIDLAAWRASRSRFVSRHLCRPSSSHFAPGHAFSGPSRKSTRTSRLPQASRRALSAGFCLGRVRHRAGVVACRIPPPERVAGGRWRMDGTPRILLYGRAVPAGFLEELFSGLTCATAQPARARMTSFSWRPIGRVAMSGVPGLPATIRVPWSWQAHPSSCWTNKFRAFAGAAPGVTRRAA